MSGSRRQIEAWLKTIDVKGSVIDVGGLFMPVKGRTKSWEVDKYVIADVKGGRKGIRTNFIWDFNIPLNVCDEYDNVFCLEVTDHFWNVGVAFRNLWWLTKKGGLLYISSNFLFPHHTGFDCIRLTDTGLKKLLSEMGFEVVQMTPRFAVDKTMEESMKKESKVVYYPGEIGYMCIARKL